MCRIAISCSLEAIAYSWITVHKIDWQLRIVNKMNTVILSAIIFANATPPPTEVGV